MNKEKKKYNVTIFGDPYVLISDNEPNHIMNVAARVDSLMQNIAEAAKSSDTKKVAVLAALQLAEKLVALENAAHDEKMKHEALLNRIDQECSSTLSS